MECVTRERFLSPLTLSAGLYPSKRVCPCVRSQPLFLLQFWLDRYKNFTIKNRHSIPWLVLGVTIRQIFSYFWPKMFKNWQLLMWAVMQDLKLMDISAGSFSWIFLQLPPSAPSSHHQVHGVTIRQIFSYFWPKMFKICKF